MQFWTIKDVENVAHRAALIQATGVFDKSVSNVWIRLKCVHIWRRDCRGHELLMAGEERVLSSAVRKTR
jgi:hypothetical protein